MMQFDIEFYVTSSGRCPVRDFLNDLKESDPDDVASVVAGLAKLRNREYHRPPLSKPIGDELFELRHVGKLNKRVLHFFMKGRRIIAVHGIRHKGREIPSKDRKTALERKNDCLARHSNAKKNEF